MRIRGANNRSLGRDYYPSKIRVVVPRLLARLQLSAAQLPLGPSAWTNTRLVLPEWTREHCFHDLFTGETLPVVEEERAVTIPVARTFATLPVAVLTKV